MSYPIVAMVTASYVKLHERGQLADRVAQAVSRLKSCRLCPRNCDVNRLNDEKGFCRTGRNAVLTSFNQHFGEERPLVGRGGSGTIFFASCNMLCSFCQNFEISHGMQGREVTAPQLAAVMLNLADAGAHNINFVTPSHIVPQILEALLIAVEQGLNLPLVYNSGGYDSVDTLKLLDGVFDIYMPDFKFWDNKWSERLCNIPDYHERVTEAVTEMHRQVGDLAMDEDGIATRGLLVRHLVMPNGIAGTPDVMRFLADSISAGTYVNVMAQYRPRGTAAQEADIDRGISTNEFAAAVQTARDAGLTRLD